MIDPINTARGIKNNQQPSPFNLKYLIKGIENKYKAINNIRLKVILIINDNIHNDLIFPSSSSTTIAASYLPVEIMVKIVVIPTNKE